MWEDNVQLHTLQTGLESVCVNGMLQSSCSRLKIASSDKIDSLFCLQQCLFLLAIHFAQILLNEFGQGLVVDITALILKLILFSFTTM